MKILITGIQGFVGSNFTRDWREQHTLYGLDINQKSKDGVSQIFSWDDLKDIPKVDSIVHLAGKAHDTKNKSLAQDYFDINTELTKKIFDYFLQSDSKKFIFFSSVKAVADSVNGEVLTEEVIPNPVGPYGESKVKAEEYILEKLSIDEKSGKQVYIMRPCMIYGEGNKGNLNLLYKVVNKGVPWPLGAYENKRSFCSIENISYVVGEFVKREGLKSGIYNVCDDETLSTNELIELIAQSLDKSAHILRLPKFSINALATIGSILHLPLTKDRLHKLTENYIVSNKKVKRELGIVEMPIRAQEGFAKTFESFNK
ncbi:nucleoside-diphosphate-sugar epimerase [Balneicella halophila]|uniref:Nucleoside-diphosphate-sugar epimerase n=1 Tax=Balneicella halophila TaxID=1537566 RepID=A0A7L4UP08_BALHA|nr:NAD-dependent epimerase/dehydratase family protein [Balneicella halophila]PVX50754.1 nucleoside-diphosphate-sugar epimerase [Balneicella halophila]